MYIKNKNDYLPTVAIINIDFDKLPLKVDNFEKHISQMHKRLLLLWYLYLFGACKLTWLARFYCFISAIIPLNVRVILIRFR